MTIQVTHKEAESLRRLGNALDSGTIPVNQVKDLVGTFRRKVEMAAAGSKLPRPRGIKENRKDQYRQKMNLS
jgi:hypothetical protein